MAKNEFPLEKFGETGLASLRGYLPSKLVGAARAVIDAELTRQKIKVGGKYSAAKLKDVPLFQQSGLLSQLVKMGEELPRLFPAELLTTMCALADAKLKAMHPYPQLLLSLPRKEEWSLHQLNWHLDLKVPKKDHVSGVQAFVLIDDVEPHGGATLALAGSHRLHYVKPGENAHGILREEAEFVTTPEKYLEARSIQGVRIQIVEMSGKAGDVFLMDLRVLHTPSSNARKKLRMMATNRFARKELYGS